MRFSIVAALAVSFSNLCSAQTSAAGDGSWSGSYFGGSIGGARGMASTKASTSMGSSSYFTGTDPMQIAEAGDGRVKDTSFSGGVFGGFGRQLDNVYVGVEASLQSLSMDDARSQTVTYITAPSSTFNIRQSIKADWEGTLRARLGMVRGGWLTYVTGGAAITRAKYSTTFSDNFLLGASGRDSTTKTLYGWTLGVGAEYALSRTLSVRGDYLYSDFGRVKTSSVISSPSFPGSSNLLNSSADLNTYSLSVGLAYRFQ